MPRLFGCFVIGLLCGVGLDSGFQAVEPARHFIHCTPVSWFHSCALNVFERLRQGRRSEMRATV